ncbi:hypothetical protein GALL_190120 [mine drainage metagenome]|uniref:Uncharacterized protein n=1 Tax=mine drainage metagenome TaxID=410659 RepID=A0A1J5SFD7_9ZZZZ
MPEPYLDEELLAGLRELAESAFPKRCGNCGREYRSTADFLAATRPLRVDCSGLKQSLGDDGKLIVDLFRNCVCGSTLLESFWNRRDTSEDGIGRRMRFQDMVDKLVATGRTAGTARNELLKLMRGQSIDLLNLAAQKKTGDV